MIRNLTKIAFRFGEAIDNHALRTLTATAVSKGHDFHASYPYLQDKTINIEHPFETFMSSIAACQTELLKAHSRRLGFKLGLIHWKKI